nr:hypothetical protein [Tanacetum cinerariifolium]
MTTREPIALEIQFDLMVELLLSVKLGSWCLEVAGKCGLKSWEWCGGSGVDWRRGKSGVKGMAGKPVRSATVLAISNVGEIRTLARFHLWSLSGVSSGSVVEVVEWSRVEERVVLRGWRENRLGVNMITIYPEPDPFQDDSEKTGKSSDDLDQLLDFNFDDVPKFGVELPSFICKIGKRNRREEMKKIDRGITMTNHTQVKAMGKLSNVLCQVGVNTIIVKFLILDIPIDHDAPIVVGRRFLYTISSILNTPDRLFSTLHGVCHQTFRAARFDVLRIAESNSDNEEEYVIKRNNVWKKAVSFLGSLPMPLKQVNWKPDYKGSYTKEEEATGQ